MSLNWREMLRLGAMGQPERCFPLQQVRASFRRSRRRRPPLPRIRRPCCLHATQVPSAPPASIRSCSRAPRRLSIRTRSLRAIRSASSTSPSRRASRASMSSTCASGPAESFRVAHGRGSDPDHSGFLERFSNDFGSHATSNGTYTTADYYQGKYGLSMKVRGLDWCNYNAEPRAIVIHNAWYAEPEMIGHSRQARPLRRLLRLLARRSMVGHAQACRRPHDLRRQARVSSIAGRPAYSLQFKTISAAAGADTPCHIAK